MLPNTDLHISPDDCLYAIRIIAEGCLGLIHLDLILLNMLHVYHKALLPQLQYHILTEFWFSSPLPRCLF